MHILLSGGCGFIGSHIVDALIKQSHQVVIIDDLSTGSLQNLNPSATFVQRSINNAPLDDVFEIYGNKNSNIKFDYVFHLAAQINLRHSIKNPVQDAQTNIMGSLNLLQCCVKYNVKRVIFSSTGGAIYSPDAVLPWDETSKIDPQSPYALSKLTVENYLKLFDGLYGLKSTILRYSNVFGPRQNFASECGIISIFIEKALKNEDLTIFGTGEQSRDFIFINDIVSANLLAMNLELDGIYNISTNNKNSINQIANIIKNATNSKSIITYSRAIDGEIMHTQLNSDKLQNLGWNINWSIEDGINEAIKYFKQDKIK